MVGVLVAAAFAGQIHLTLALDSWMVGTILRERMICNEDRSMISVLFLRLSVAEFHSL